MVSQAGLSGLRGELPRRRLRWPDLQETASGTSQDADRLADPFVRLDLHRMALIHHEKPPGDSSTVSVGDSICMAVARDGYVATIRVGARIAHNAVSLDTRS